MKAPRQELAVGSVDGGALPPQVEESIQELAQAARTAFGENLRSLVLFGSAAEGQMRPTSDVNLIFVLRRFEQKQVDLLRNPLRLAHAAVRASAMFLLEDEIATAMEAFAVKFSDIGRRRRVLHGEDVFARLAPSRAALIQRTQQVLLNLALRLRNHYVLASLREERLAQAVADAAGPLRAAAATLLELEGQPVLSPKESLVAVVRRLDEPGWDEVLSGISEARQGGALPPGAGGRLLFRLIELAGKMEARVAALK
jgi:predicted nucleotidyltransferase